MDCSSTDVQSFRKCKMYQTYVATSWHFGEKPACSNVFQDSLNMGRDLLYLSKLFVPPYLYYSS
eukprot:4525182-Ditylum_brightwellii.AAC.1